METEEELVARDIEGYLVLHQQKELLRFVTVGSVDDGKSTLIGRLLHDTHGIYEDQLSQVKRASGRANVEIDFSLFTDGLKAEREQGITIDVAYRYFSTQARKFIIADTPGHVQYTRNMATGASTADLAIILIDARLGVQEQSRRHATIASLLGIPHLCVCVNKMDLVGWSEARFHEITAEFVAFARGLRFQGVHLLPVSALLGDNVVHPSAHAPWYAGGTLLRLLETVELPRGAVEGAFRYPVQTVLRPHLDYRGFAGQIAAGVVRRGDRVVALPSRRESTVVGIDTFSGEVPEAFAPQSVTLRLADEIDLSRGDMLVHPGALPRVAQRFSAMLVWMSERPLDTGKAYLLKHTTQLTRAQVLEVSGLVDLATHAEAPAERLELNDIGKVELHTHRPLFIDAYHDQRATGAFILIDSLTNDTVAAGMILPEEGAGERHAEGSAGPQVSAAERAARLGQRGAVLLLVDADAARRQALAWSAERLLFDAGGIATVVRSESEQGAASADGALVAALAGAGLLVVWSAPGFAPSVPEALGAQLDAARCVLAADLPAATDPERAVQAAVEAVMAAAR